MKLIYRLNDSGSLEIALEMKYKAFVFLEQTCMVLFHQCFGIQEIDKLECLTVHQWHADITNYRIHVLL